MIWKGFTRGILLFPLTLAFSCSHITIEESAVDNTLLSDTTVFICGKHHSSIPLSLGHSALSDFISFSEVYCNGIHTYENTDLIDTTGDGSKERVTSFVSFTQDRINIQNTIHNRDGKLLWRDKYSLDKKKAAEIFGNQEIFDRFYPLSAFYAGILSSAFIDSLDKKSHNHDKRKKELLRHIAKTSDTEDLQKLYESELSEFIDSYQGKYVFTLDPQNRRIYMWSEEKNAFVPLTVS